MNLLAMLLRFCRGVRTQGLRTTIKWSLRRTKNRARQFCQIARIAVPDMGLRAGLGAAWRLRPIAGGAPDDDDSDDDEDSDDDDSGSDDDDSGDDDDQDDDADDDSDDDEPDDDEPLTDKERSELNRLKREAAEKAKRERKAKKKQAEETGKWKELHETTEKERDDAVEELESLKTEFATFKGQIKVSRLAKKLKYVDPDDAHKFLPDDVADGTDAQVEKALRKVLKEKPYLKEAGGSRRTRSGGGGGDDDNEGDTPDLDSMTPAEIREWEAKL